MPSPRLDTAGIFERVFSVYRKQAGVLLPAAFLLYLIPAALSVVKGTSPQALSLAFTLIAGVWYQGMVVQAVRDIQDDVRDLSIAGLFRSVTPVLAPLLWTGIVVVVGVCLGVVAFLIPGLVLLTWWCVAAPAVVMERLHVMEALRRSRALVQGHGWQVFGVLMVTAAIVLVVDLVLATAASAISGGKVSLAVASLLGGVLTAPFFGLASAVLYLALRRARGEAAPAAGADAF
jgi:hypothetical protein